MVRRDDETETKHGSKQVRRTQHSRFLLPRHGMRRYLERRQWQIKLLAVECDVIVMKRNTSKAILEECDA